jgi:hypothetical protein
MNTRIQVLLLVSLCCPLLAQQHVQIGFANAGLSSIRYAGTELLARGSFQVNAVGFETPSGLPSTGSLQVTRTSSDGGKTELLSFNWGSVKVDYAQQGDILSLAIGVFNQTNLTLKTISLDALAIQLPSTPKEYDGKTPMLGTNIGAPTVLPLTCQNVSVVVTDDDVTKPLLLGMPWSLNAPARTIFPIRINTGRDPMYPDSLPYIDRPIAPGKHESILVSLRFSSPEAPAAVSPRDVLTRFAGLNAFSLHWPDRRPIGSLILATAATKWSGNPRGWLLDPTINIHTTEGLAAFHKRILAWADHSIAILKRMNAQGMITWDIEGEEFPHPITYIGDPIASAKLAPEMNAIVDDYFKRFITAGLRVGVTIRPQYLDQTGGLPRQTQSSDPAAELIRKISYARKRWGATLFYIDSNGDAVLPLSFDVIKKVARAFPDVLLIPEHKNLAYYSFTAPYSESRHGTYSTPTLARSIYPNSFSVINTADSAVDQHRSDLLDAVNRGDILMFRAWFDDPANTTVKAIYAQSKFKAH